jgi:Flp pilus assembly protein TadG
MKPSKTREGGAVVVEFALVLPILVMLVFGIIGFGQGYNATIELRGAAREGARVLALPATPGGPGADATTAETAVKNAAPTICPTGSSCTAITFPTSPQTCAPGDGAAGKNATITASYNLQYDIPPFWSGTWTITSTGVMRCET